MPHNGRDAVRLAVTNGNVVTKNMVNSNVFGIGVADFSANNLVEKNVAPGNEAFGIAAYSGATGTIISKNEETERVQNVCSMQMRARIGSRLPPSGMWLSAWGVRVVRQVPSRRGLPVSLFIPGSFHSQKSNATARSTATVGR